MDKVPSTDGVLAPRLQEPLVGQGGSRLCARRPPAANSISIFIYDPILGVGGPQT